MLFGFYIPLYYTEWFTAPAQALGLGSKWTLYGLIYSIAIVSGGLYVIRKYQHNRYQIVRTCVVMAVQVVLAFSVPLILKFLHQPEFYFSYLWPLKFDYLNPGYIFSLPAPFIIYSFLGSLLMAPVLGIFSYRGVPLAAVDLRARLGHPPRPPSRDDHFLLVQAARRAVALVVDRVTSSEPFPPAGAQAAPLPSRHIAGVVTLPDGLLLIEDLDAVLSLDEEAAIDAGAQRLGAA